VKNTNTRIHFIILAVMLLGGLAIGYRAQDLLPLPDPVLPAVPNYDLDAPWYSMSCTNTGTGMVCIAVPYLPEFLDNTEDVMNRG
jgi:hypothetical protein